MSNRNVISELVNSGIVVEETQLTINNETQQTIPLTEIKQLSRDGDTKYISWFLMLLIPTCIILYAFSSELHTSIKWLLLVIGGILGLKILLGPPEHEYIVINMKQRNSIRVPMKDRTDNELEFIRKTNQYIYSLNKTD